MADSRIERKLAAILYADVAGYSRLTGVDEEGTHRRLSTYLDAISAAVESHGGRIVHYAGDAVLADYSSVADAVSCALAIQTDLRTRNEPLPPDRRVEFRIGINLGDVMVDRNDIYGDGVNVAARLEGLAEAGGICVSEAVYDQVRDRLDLEFQFLGRQRVKNIAQPIVAYHVLMDGVTPPTCGKPGFWSRFREKKRLIGLALAGVAVGAIAAAIMVTAALGPPDTAPSVAVMPFRMIGEGEPADFGDGLTEDLVTELAKKTDLRVTVLQVGPEAGSESDPSDVRARYRVEGTVRVSEGRVRITAQLIGTDTGYHLWGARYDRSLMDTLTVQAEVASRVVANLEQRLIIAEAERAEAGTTVTGVLLQGLEQIGRSGEQAVSKVVELYDRLFGG